MTRFKGNRFSDLYDVPKPVSHFPLSVPIWYGNQGVMLRGVSTVSLPKMHYLHHNTCTPPPPTHQTTE